MWHRHQAHGKNKAIKYKSDPARPLMLSDHRTTLMRCELPVVAWYIIPPNQMTAIQHVMLHRDVFGSSEILASLRVWFKYLKRQRFSSLEARRTIQKMEIFKVNYSLFIIRLCLMN